MKELKLVFMGTPEFALPSLELLYLSPHKLALLVVPPDKPSGRGGKVRFAPTKNWALEKNISLVQPQKISDQDFLSGMENVAPDLIITAAYGKILPPPLLKLPRLGCINLHASYLPFYRGSAPIHRAVIDGAVYSGVSVMKMVSELDAGDILMQEKEDILPFDTAGTLHDRLADRGASLLLRTVNALASGDVKAFPQDHKRATYAPPLTPEDEQLDWSRGAEEIYNRIRGLNPWPGAYTCLNGKRIKVWQAARPEDDELYPDKAPGTILTVGENSLTVATGSVPLTILNLQPAGKKAMDAGSFCCGYRVEAGQVLAGEPEN